VAGVEEEEEGVVEAEVAAAVGVAVEAEAARPS
jgi:hypothetical protein